MTTKEPIDEKYLIFLDDLRESGVTNMFGAAPYVERAFKLSKRESLDILKYWMKTFSERHSVGTIRLVQMKKKMVEKVVVGAISLHDLCVRDVSWTDDGIDVTFTYEPKDMYNGYKNEFDVLSGFSCECRFDYDDNPSLFVVGHRPETDKEYEKRVAKEKKTRIKMRGEKQKAKKAAEEREYKNYLRLKEKYENK